MKRTTRKPRTKSVDMTFDGAHIFGQPTTNVDTICVEKISKRLREGKCLGCGKKECQCKRKLKK